MPKRKTPPTSENLTEGGDDKDPPPAYGSQEYWEKRYSVLQPQSQKSKLDAGVGDDGSESEEKSDALPGHSWYFTYDELRPLILPLLLGREEEEKEEEWEEEEEEEEEESDEKVACDDGKDEQQKESNADKQTTDVVPKNGAVDAYHPPKSVLEVGCGDVPLGEALRADLLRSEKESGAPAENVVKRIVCNDYSKVVIDVLRERQKQRWSTSGTMGSYEITNGRDGMKVEDVVIKSSSENTNGCEAAINTLDVSYIAEDARNMTHKNESFDLVIDKGTLDALLSDKEIGTKNCVSVVSEMARVVAIGGFIVIVSHMNAHVQSGIEWCDEVVAAGLRASGASASWEIEVHGSDGSNNDDDDIAYDEEEEEGEVAEVEEGEGVITDDNAEGDEEGEDEEEITSNDEKGSSSGSPGPAVYIIHKMAPKLLTKNSPAAANGIQNGSAGDKAEAEAGAKEEEEGEKETKAIRQQQTTTIPLKCFTY